MIETLLKACKIDKLKNAVAAGATDITDGDIIDLSGFEGVLLVASLATVVDGSVVTLKAYCGDAANLSDGAYKTTTAALTAATSSNTLVVLDVKRPGKRYVRADLGRATQNAAVDCIMAIRYGAAGQPVVQPADVSASAISIN